MENKEKYCCGMHEICEEGRLKRPCEQAEYYDDDELDVLKGKASDDYTSDEIEQFREILHTMYVSDVPGWLQSLKLREIAFPDALNDTLSQIIRS